MNGSLKLSQLANDAGGHLEGADVSIAGVSTDSRSVAPGDIYFCLRGERFDGHDYAEAALQKGVAALVVERPIATEVTQLVVPDTRVAFGLLARLWRRTMAAVVIGVTGSNGKTTVKQMLASVCAAACDDEGQVHYTRANDNNDIGVPQTLLGIQEHHRFAVIEMGANLRGEIAWLGKIVEPDVALITNVSESHLEGFGLVEDVAAEKAGIYDSLGDDGVAVVNLDDAFAGDWMQQNSNRQIVTFGWQNPADVQVVEGDDSPVLLQVQDRQLAVRLQLAGKHNAMNAAATVAVAQALQLTDAVVIAGLENTTPVKGRLNYHTLADGFTVIDDTYNANPASTRAAIDVLVKASGRRVLVLGDLRELGDDAEQLHQAIGSYAREAGVEQIFATGALTRHTVDAFGIDGRWFESRDELLGELLSLGKSDTSFLIKGSRSMQMNLVVDALLQQPTVASVSGGSLA